MPRPSTTSPGAAASSRPTTLTTAPRPPWARRRPLRRVAVGCACVCVVVCVREGGGKLGREKRARGGGGIDSSALPLASVNSPRTQKNTEAKAAAQAAAQARAGPPLLEALAEGLKAGPLGLLHRCFSERKPVCVMVRRIDGWVGMYVGWFVPPCVCMRVSVCLLACLGMQSNFPPPTNPTKKKTGCGAR